MLDGGSDARKNDAGNNESQQYTGDQKKFLHMGEDSPPGKKALQSTPS
jgi:hypothetical protein